MLYQTFKVNKITIEGVEKLWDTPKNIEVDVKWVQKKEELEKEINENKYLKWVRLIKLEK